MVHGFVESSSHFIIDDGWLELSDPTHPFFVTGCTAEISDCMMDLGLMMMGVIIRSTLHTTSLFSLLPFMIYMYLIHLHDLRTQKILPIFYGPRLYPPRSFRPLPAKKTSRAVSRKHLIWIIPGLNQSRKHLSQHTELELIGIQQLPPPCRVPTTVSDKRVGWWITSMNQPTRLAQSASLNGWLEAIGIPLSLLYISRLKWDGPTTNSSSLRGLAFFSAWLSFS